jgi:hypothetical protein
LQPSTSKSLKVVELLSPILWRDFYFRALRSLVVLSFPQLISFSSVFPKPLSETLRRSLDGRIPVKLTVSVLMCGAVSCGAASRGAGRKGPRGTGQDRVWLYVRARFRLSRAKLALTFQSTFSERLFPLSLCK